MNFYMTGEEVKRVLGKSCFGIPVSAEQQLSFALPFNIVGYQYYLYSTYTCVYRPSRSFCNVHAGVLLAWQQHNYFILA